MSSKPVELTEAEWTIIKAVWEHEPTTAPAIQEALLPLTRWTYSTVRTLMDRMVAKNLLSADKTRHPTVYCSAVTRDEARRGEIGYALKHAFDGALTPMVQCLLDQQSLTPTQIKELEELIRAKKRTPDAQRPPKAE